MPPQYHRLAPALGLCVVGWATLGGAACAAVPVSEPKFGSAEATAEYYILAGEMAANRKQPALAAASFLKALDHVPDAGLAERATALALNAADEDLALRAARRWLELEETSLEAREVIARVALRKGLLDETYEQGAAIVRGHAGGEDEGFRHVALLLSQEAAHGEGALAVLKRLRESWSQLAGAHYAVGLAALRFQDPELAESSAREALRLQPDSREALLLLTGVLVKRGNLEAADQVVDEILKDGKTPAAELRLGYVKLLLDGNHYAHAQRQLDLILRGDPNNADAHFALGLLALEAQNADVAETHFKAVAAQGARKADAAYYLGRIAELRDRPDDALRWYEQVTGGNQTIDAAVRRALLLGERGKLDEARGLLERQRRLFPPLATRFYLAEGELLLQANRDEQALAVYETALQQDPDNADLFYSRSLAFERLNRIDRAEADLRRILDADKDDARALNALGYMLAVHTERLEEARGLIGRAMDLDPDDAAVIDSMGWVHYRLGNLKEARSLLEKAFDKFKDPEVAAHLGEVLWKMGDKDRARAIWDAALSEDPDHRVLRETVDRLTR